MAKNPNTSAAIDALLQIFVLGTMITTTLVAPNALQALDKPLDKYFKRMDRRKREREYSRLLSNMKKQGLISVTDSKINVTSAGKRRADKAYIKALRISKPAAWDKKWRVIIFDVPEIERNQRNLLTSCLRALGLVPLQQSVWISPYRCFEEVRKIADFYGVSNYVNYIEADYVESQSELRARFRC